MAKKAAGTPATTLLTAEKVAHTLHPYQVSPDAPDYGALVAEALGVPPERLFKTLIAEVDGALAVAVVPVTGDLDLKALAHAAGGKRATWPTAPPPSAAAATSAAASARWASAGGCPR
jgi:Cys-tRNA(Pro)/Cys-tRNA(Cys) deacylase